MAIDRGRSVEKKVYRRRVACQLFHELSHAESSKRDFLNENDLGPGLSRVYD